MEKKEVIIASASRTAVGSLGKSLKNIPADLLGSSVISQSIKRSKLNNNDIDVNYMIHTIKQS